MKMGILDRLRGKGKKEPEKDEDLASIIDEAADEALAEMGFGNDENIGNEETIAEIEEGFDEETRTDIEDEIKKDMESDDVHKKIEDKIKKKRGV